MFFSVNFLKLESKWSHTAETSKTDLYSTFFHGISSSEFNTTWRTYFSKIRVYRDNVLRDPCLTSQTQLSRSQPPVTTSTWSKKNASQQLISGSKTTSHMCVACISYLPYIKRSDFYQFYQTHF